MFLIWVRFVPLILCVSYHDRDVITNFAIADIRRGEYITGFVVRSGFWIDAIQVLTSLGRRSPLFGNPHGGDP